MLHSENPLLLQSALLETQDWLQSLAESETFLDILIRSFGDSLDLQKATIIRQQWAMGDFTNLPDLEIRFATELNGANGVYAKATNTIYLSKEFLDINASSTKNITSVLLEEIGHYVDAQINATDALGDEGKIFSTLVRGEQLSATQLQQLRSEDDTAIISLDGKPILVEQNTDFTITVSDPLVIEGDGAKATFTITFSRPPSHYLHYYTKDKTAKGGLGGQDYVITNGQPFSFGTTNDTTLTVTVPISNDALDEDSETFSLIVYDSLSGIYGEGTATIFPDSDPAPEISIVADQSAEIDRYTSESDQEASFTIQLSQPSGKTVKVKYSTSDGTSTNQANAGLDFIGVSNQEIVFNPGEISKTVTIMPIRDNPPTDHKHKTFEIFAKDTAYRNWNIGDDVDKDDIDKGLYSDLGYTVDKVFPGTGFSDGFYAVGLTSDEKFSVEISSPTNATIGTSKAEGKIIDHTKEPVLAVRGTEPTSPFDWYTNANFHGVGLDQFDNNADDVEAWLDEQFNNLQSLSRSPDTGPSITGHSLGGALSQLIAADYYTTHIDNTLSQVVTFNSPGINKTTWKIPPQYQMFYGSEIPLSSTESASKVTHYITSGDLVSMAGKEFLPGKYVLSTYVSSFFDIVKFTKHGVPVLVDEIARNGAKKPYFSEPQYTGSTDELNKFTFGYHQYSRDPDYFALQLALCIIPILGPATAIGMFFRGTSETVRQAFGLARTALIDAPMWATDIVITAATNALRQYTPEVYDVLEYLTNKAAYGMGLIDEMPEDETYFTDESSIQPLVTSTPTTASNFWEAASKWSAEAWNATTQWVTTHYVVGDVEFNYPHAWYATTQWSPAAWNATTQWSPAAWNATTQWSEDAWTATTQWSDADWNKPFFIISEPSLVEGDSGISNLIFTVSLSSASTQAIAVNYATANGTATAGSDYTSTTGILTFTPGQISNTIAVPIIGDTLFESNETLTLNLSNPSNALIAQTTVTGTIIDNENTQPSNISTLQFSAPTYSINEDGDILEPLVMVTRTGSSVGAVSATVNFTGGTATGSTILLADYLNQPITVSFANGETTAKKIIVPIWDDTVVEGNETINLSLSNPTGGAVIGTQEIATVTIVDNDAASTSGILQFSSPTYSIDENGTPVAAITVTRTGDSTGAVSAKVNFTGGIATGGTPTLVSPEDYDNTPIVVSFADGDTTNKTIIIPILNDTIDEPNETINLSLSNPTGGAAIGTQSTSTVTILDDDPTPTPGILQFAASTYSINEDGSAIAAVTVNRINGSDGIVSATVNLSNGTAIAPGDYDNNSITVTFENGETSKTIALPIINDVLYEADETINLTLSNPTGGATIGTQSTAALMIANDDALAIANPISNLNATEDASFSFTIPANTFNADTTISLNYTATLSDGSDLPSWLTFNTATRTFSGTPLNENVGAIAVQVTASDTNGNSASNTFNLTVLNTNDAPTLTGSPATLTSEIEDTAYIINATDLLTGFTDVDGDQLSIIELTTSNGSLVDNNNGTYTFTPTANFNGIANLSYNVIDSNGGITPATQSFTITGVNDAPNLTGMPATLTAGIEDTTYTINAADLWVGFSDVDGDSLSIANLAATNGSLVDNNNGTYSFTPTANFNGIVNLSYNVIDSNGGITPATQSFTIAGVNDAPVLTVPGTQTVNSNTNLTIAGISVTDVDAGSNPIEVTLSAPNGVLSLSTTAGLTFVAGDGTQDNTLTFRGVLSTINTALTNLVYRAKSGFSGNDAITLTVNDLGNTDGSPLSTTQTINLTVNNMITGTSARETFTATPNADHISTAGSNDTVIATVDNLQQSDILDGGTGTDLFRLSGGTSATALTLTLTTPSNQLAGIPGLTLSNFEQFDLSGFAGTLTVVGSTGSDRVQGGAGNDVMNAGAGNDIFQGGAGDDLLNGGSGADQLIGESGNDTYIVDNLSDRITEGLNAGIDTVQSSVTYTLGSNLENLTLIDSGNINGTGNALNNIITGNSGNNILRGSGGADTLTGASGVNTFVVGSLSDSLLSGFDHITDLKIGIDRIDGPRAVNAASVAELGEVASLTESAIASVLTASSFLGNRAATFTFADAGESRTFLALNNGIAAFQASSDAIIEITGYSGNLTNLAII
jgi:Ca2+-binding RTX toxin-like protein